MRTGTVGIYGLGLIGGSFVKAYHAAGWTVLAANRSSSVLDFAKLSGEVDGDLTADSISECDLVLLTAFPEASIRMLREWAPHIGKKPLVMDCCSTKRGVCQAAFALAEEYGFAFVGGHPMAGTQYSGYKYAKTDMFLGQPMVIVPMQYDDIYLLDRVKELLLPAGFAHISVTTAEKHDEIIAFTSQMAHVVSTSYVKSPTAKKHHGFSAGSYKDMTRVARLNPVMWSELFMENRDNLIREVDCLISHLQEYRDAMEKGDREAVRALLEEGRQCKEAVDGL